MRGGSPVRSAPNGITAARLRCAPTDPAPRPRSKCAPDNPRAAAGPFGGRLGIRGVRYPGLLALARLRSIRILLESFLCALYSSPPAAGPDHPRRRRRPAPGCATALDSACPGRAVSLWTRPVDHATPALAINATAPMNPASVVKLVTAFSALERLGPARTWTTRIARDGDPVPAGCWKATSTSSAAPVGCRATTACGRCCAACARGIERVANCLSCSMPRCRRRRDPTPSMARGVRNSGRTACCCNTAPCCSA